MTPDQEKDAGQKDDLAVAAEKAFKAPFGAVLHLAPETGAALWVDGRAASPVVSATAPETPKGGADALCVWRGQRDSLIRALSGERAFESAFVSGRIAVSGDMSVMARLAIEGGR